MRARVVAIAQGETPGSFDITVVQNNASKYQAIDNGATLVPENNDGSRSNIFQAEQTCI
jgi:predicted phage tail protein